MKTKSRSGVVALAFSLSLLCMFAASALLVVLMGAKVYSATTADMTANYNVRTSVSYIAEKVHRCGEPGSVAAGSFGDNDSLELTQTIGGERYTTYICQRRQAAGNICQVRRLSGPRHRPSHY